MVAAYRCATLPFPAVLDALALPAFDAVKGVDAFLRANAAAPRGVKRHIYALEERCLESVAWAAGSPLYTLLAAAGGGGDDDADDAALSPASTPLQAQGCRLRRRHPGRDSLQAGGGGVRHGRHAGEARAAGGG